MTQRVSIWLFKWHDVTRLGHDSESWSVAVPLAAVSHSTACCGNWYDIGSLAAWSYLCTSMKSFISVSLHLEYIDSVVRHRNLLYHDLNYPVVIGPMQVMWCAQITIVTQLPQCGIVFPRNMGASFWSNNVSSITVKPLMLASQTKARN